MKKLAVFIVIVALILVSGCVKTESNEPNNRESVDRFYYLDNISGFIGGQTTIIVDKQTRVCYMFQKHGYAAGMVAMIDTDGRPLLYEGEFKDE